MILRARQGLHGYASPGALVAPVQRDRQAQPRPRRSASSTCDDAWDFEQGPVNVTMTNDGVRVVIAPPTPVDAVVQTAHLLTFGEEGRAGCPTFKPTKNSGLGLLVPVSKFDLCTPTGVGDSGQRYSMRMRIDSFPADKACQSGDITPDQPYGWAFRQETICAEGTMDAVSSAVVPVHVPERIDCGKVRRRACMRVQRSCVRGEECDLYILTCLRSHTVLHR